MPKRRAKSLWFNLGSMFGHIAAGVKADPKNPPARLDPKQPPTLVNEHTREVTVNTPGGPVTLRRTVTDEIVPPPPPRP